MAYKYSYAASRQNLTVQRKCHQRWEQLVAVPHLAPALAGRWPLTRATVGGNPLGRSPIRIQRMGSTLLFSQT